LKIALLISPAAYEMTVKRGTSRVSRGVKMSTERAVRCGVLRESLCVSWR
jgi:hypothetical protein